MAAEAPSHPLLKLPRLLWLYARLDLLLIARGIPQAAAWFASDLLVSIGAVGSHGLMGS